MNHEIRALCESGNCLLLEQKFGGEKSTTVVCGENAWILIFCACLIIYWPSVDSKNCCSSWTGLGMGDDITNSMDEWFGP